MKIIKESVSSNNYDKYILITQLEKDVLDSHNLLTRSGLFNDIVFVDKIKRRVIGQIPSRKISRFGQYCINNDLSSTEITKQFDKLISDELNIDPIFDRDKHKIEVESLYEGLTKKEVELQIIRQHNLNMYPISGTYIFHDSYDGQLVGIIKDEDVKQFSHDAMHIHDNSTYSKKFDEFLCKYLPIKPLYERPKIEIESLTERIEDRVQGAIDLVLNLHNLECINYDEGDYVDSLTGEIILDGVGNYVRAFKVQARGFLSDGTWTYEDAAKRFEDILISINDDIPRILPRKKVEVECMNEFGTIEYERNEGKHNRIKRYREMVQLDESEQITEDNIMKWAFNQLCMEENISPSRLRSELLGEI